MMAPWPEHQARAGGHGADGAGIGERDRGALEIGGREFALCGRGRPDRRRRSTYSWKFSAPAFLMLGTIRLRAPSLPGDVDGDAEIDLRMQHAEGLAVLFGVGVVEPGDVFQRLDDGPADEVRVGDFAAADQRAVLIDDAPVFVHHFDGDGALRGGERDGDAGRHILGDASGGAAQGLQLLAGGGFGRGCGGAGARRGPRRTGRRCSARRGALRIRASSSHRPWSGRADTVDTARLRASC